MPTRLQAYSYLYGNPSEYPSVTRTGIMRRTPTSTALRRKPVRKFVKKYPNPKISQNRNNALVKYAPSRMYNFRPMNIFVRPPVVGLQHRARLLYNETVSLTSGATAGNIGFYAYSANGLFDPNITSTGHQAIGFDQLMALYEHYTVTAAKFTVTFVNDENKYAGNVGISISPDASLPSTMSATIENGLCSRSFINTGNAGASTVANNYCQITMPVDIRQINGRQAPIVGDELYRGDSASNPTEQTYVALWVANPFSSNSMTVHAVVDIEFDAVFTEPRKLAQS